MLSNFHQQLAVHFFQPLQPLHWKWNDFFFVIVDQCVNEFYWWEKFVSFIYRARDKATLIRLGHLTMPKCLVTSICNPPGQVLVVEIKITFRSRPWNSSTVPTLMSGYAVKLYSMARTCKTYGVITPISFGFKPFAVIKSTVILIYLNKRKTSHHYFECMIFMNWTIQFNKVEWNGYFAAGKKTISIERHKCLKNFININI